MEGTDFMSVGAATVGGTGGAQGQNHFIAFSFAFAALSSASFFFLFAVYTGQFHDGAVGNSAPHHSLF
jgi:hypothetical protein